MHGRFVLEPRNFKEKRGNMTFDEHSQMMFFFDEQFGKERGIDSKGSKNGNICVFAFEPNPKHQERHLHMQNVYSKFGLRYHPIFKGVSDQDGTMTFFHQDQGKNNEWGFSVVKRYPRKKLAKINNVTTTEVEIIRLSKWLEKHILHRQIPDFEINPKIKAKVVMKMDVEGMEYILWPDLFFSGILCQTVDYITTEFHPWRPVDFSADEISGNGGMKLNTPEAKHFASMLLLAFNSLRNDDCKLKKIKLLDDESYLFDGYPFPSIQK